MEYFLKCLVLLQIQEGLYIIFGLHVTFDNGFRLMTKLPKKVNRFLFQATQRRKK